MDHSEILIFDRRAVRMHRERSARLSSDSRFLVHEVRQRMVDRLQDVKRDFATVLGIGCGDEDLSGDLIAIGRHSTVIASDSIDALTTGKSLALILDEEALPFAMASLDLVISVLSLHWTNDLPGALLQLRRALRPDGLLIAGIWGGETLHELRTSLLSAELQLRGGGEQRVSPFADVRDAGGLLQRAGFALPVVDCDTLTVTYPNMFRLMHDLRGMGETNALIGRQKTAARRDVFLRAAEIYAEKYGTADGRITATFQLLTLTAWAPSPEQPRALRPGSASKRLSDALDRGGESKGDNSKI